MISTQRFRPTIQITLNDIFQDFDDPRKDILMKRVAIAMEHLEKRMKNQIQANTLSNLQVLFKKQQALKNMEEKLHQKIEENAQYKHKQVIYSNKIQELQSEIIKKQEAIKSVQAQYQQKNLQILQNYEELKLKVLKKQNIKKVEQQQKDSFLQKNLSLAKKIDDLEMQCDKYEVIIKRLKDSLNQKNQENELLQKIKQQKLNGGPSQYLQRIDSLKKYQNTLQNKSQIQQNKHLKNYQDEVKIYKKNQQIQVNLVQIKEQTQEDCKFYREKETQTENLQPQINKKSRRSNLQKKQSIIQPQIVASSLKQQQYWQQNRLNQSKIGDYPKKITVQKLVQTEFVFQTKINKKHISRFVQVELKNTKLDQACQLMKSQLLQLEQKYCLMQQHHKQKYTQIVRYYQQKILQDKDVQQKEILRLNVLQLQNQLQKNKYQMNKQRQILISINENLSKNQNLNLMNKLNGQLIEKLQFYRRPKVIKSKTVYSYSSKPKRCITLNFPENNTQGWEEYNQESTDDTILLKSKKLQDSQVQVITVINGQGSLKNYTQKNQTVNCVSFIKQVHNNRNYKRLSEIKKRSLNY